jgi:glycosyltransferase involved in cell wall biosynthesis
LRLDPSTVRTVPPAVEDDRGPVGAAPHAAAKVALGLDPGAVVVVVLGVSPAPADGWHAAVAAAGAVLVDAAATEAELVEAACDVVVVRADGGGPPVELLRAMRGGAVAVAAGSPTLADLLTADLSGVVLDPAALAAGAPDGPLTAALADLVQDPARRATLARAGSERVRDAFSAAAVAPRWLDLLTPALPSRR